MQIALAIYRRLVTPVMRNECMGRQAAMLLDRQQSCGSGYRVGCPVIRRSLVQFPGSPGCMSDPQIAPDEQPYVIKHF